MAVIVTDNRVVIDQADTLTGWTSADSLFTTAPAPVEAGSCIGIQVSNETRQTYFTRGTAVDMSGGTLFYAWGLPGGVLDTIVNGGIALIIGDGTNTGAYHVGGSDVAGFRHDNGPVFWQCYVLDSGNLPANVTTVAGTPANINLASVTQFGVQYKTLVKSVGGVENCFIDIMRVGNNGITVSGGSSADPGTFLEIATSDRQTGNLQAHGVLRELGSDLYGAQGSIFFGSTGTASSYFKDTDATLAFEDRNQTVDKYRVVIQGNTTGATTFIIGNRVDDGIGSDGCTLVAAEGLGAQFIATDVNVNAVGIYGSILSGFTQGISFSSNSSNAFNHDIFSTSFISCGQISPGLTEFQNNSIINSVATAAVRIISTGGLSGLSFTSAGTGHAIVIDIPGTYSFNNFDYTGYATVDGSTGNEAFYNNSGGDVTIFITDGESPTVRNSAGSTTNLIATSSVTLTGLRDNTEVRVYSSEDNVAPYATPVEIAGIEDATQGTLNDRTFTFTATQGTTVYIKTFNVGWIADDITLTVPQTSTRIPVAQRRDRVFSNP